MSEQKNEIQACVSLLREIAEICEHATLMGSLDGGATRTVLRYNATLARLLQLEVVQDGFFQPLPETAGFGEIGVESRMLASFVPGQGHRPDRHREPSLLMRLAPFVESKDLGLMVREQLKAGINIDMEQLTQLAPFLDQEMLGELVRKSLTGEAVAPTEPIAPVEPVAPVAPVAPAKVWVEKPVEAPSLDELLERLKQPHLSTEERDQVLEQIRYRT
ncbi:MAG: hypothetical protein H7Y17_04330 [Chlorobia bacterium]|nr:hypothetical protein [Fimbriimonadaceae bacterium]